MDEPQNGHVIPLFAPAIICLLVGPEPFARRNTKCSYNINRASNSVNKDRRNKTIYREFNGNDYPRRLPLLFTTAVRWVRVRVGHTGAAEFSFSCLSVENRAQKTMASALDCDL